MTTFTASMIGAGSIERVEPEAVGLSTVRLSNISACLMREVGSERIPGAVIGVARGGKIAYLDGMGYRDPASKTPMMADAIFSVASMTKPMVSAVAMQLVEEGLLLLGDPVSAYLPQLADLKVLEDRGGGQYSERTCERQPTVQDLLRHTSGFTYKERGNTPAHQRSPGSSVKASVALSREEFLAALGEAPLLFEPGTTWEYGFSTDVLGLVIEAVLGRSLGDVLRERLWSPLGMNDTGFELSADGRPRYALAFPADPLTGKKQAVHHAGDGTTKWQSGGGGAISTALDYLNFLEMMRAQGVFGGQRILSRKTVELMTSDHLGADIKSRIADTMDPAAAGYGFGLGFAVRRQAGVSAMYGSPRDYYWSGVYGTYFWVDPIEDLTVVFMAAAPGLIRLRYRQLARALVYQAIVD